MASDPAEQLLRRLNDDAVLARQIPRPEDGERILRERRRHVRTVRSAAAARNRRRPALPWLLLAILIALLAFTATLASAAPADRAADPPAVDATAIDRLDADADADADAADDLRDALADDDELRDELRDSVADDEGQRDDLDDLDDGLAARGDLGAWLDRGDDPTEAIDDVERDDASADDTDDAASTRAAVAGADEAREAALRGRRSPIGRVDLSLYWRHTDPMISPVRDEVWLTGTWRR